MFTVQKHIQYFYNQTILDKNVGQGDGEGAATEYFSYVAPPSGSCLNLVDE